MEEIMQLELRQLTHYLTLNSRTFISTIYVHEKPILRNVLMLLYMCMYVCVCTHILYDM